MKRLLALLFLLVPAGVWAQTAALPVQQCMQPGTQAAVSGLISTNYQMGIVPSCTVTVYLTGTQTIATTTPQTPLTASPTGQFLIYAPINAGYDVVLSGGISPNTYPSPVTITNQFAGGSGCINGGSLAQGCTGAITALAAAANIVQPVTWVAITEPPYNAVGDCTRSGSTSGCTANVTNIQAAIDYCFTVGCTVMLPANPNTTNGQTVYYLGGTLNPRGVSIIGPNGAAGYNDVAPAVVLRGAPGMDVFATGDPMNSGWTNPNDAFRLAHMGLVVDDTEDVSCGTGSCAAFVQNRLPGRTIYDLVCNTSNTSVTSATAMFQPGDVGQNFEADGCAAGGTPLTTTIASFISSTSVTLAVQPSAAHSGGHAYISVMGLSTTQTIGNCAWAYDNAASGTVVDASGADFTNVAIYTVSGKSYQNNSCGYLFQGNSLAYGTHWQHDFVEAPFGFAFINSNQAVSAQFNSGLGGFNTFDGVWISSKQPWLSYQGAQTRLSNIELSGVQQGPNILAAYGITGEPNTWSISIEEEEAYAGWDADCPAGSTAYRISGVDFLVQHLHVPDCVPPNTMTLEWDASGSVVQDIYLASMSPINVSGNYNSFRSLTYASYAITWNVTGVGDTWITCTPTSFYGGVEPGRCQYGAPGTFTPFMGPPNLARSKSFFEVNHDFIGRGAVNYYYNDEDLWFWPTDLIGYNGVTPIVQADSASQTGLAYFIPFATVPSPNYTMDEIGNANLRIGSEIPEGNIRVYFYAMASAAQNFYADIVYGTSEPGTSLGCSFKTTPMALTTSYAIYSCDVAISSSLAGDRFGIRLGLNNAITSNVSIGWIAIKPWNSDFTATSATIGAGSTPITGSVGTGGNAVEASALGTATDCANWTAAGIGDSGGPCNSPIYGYTTLSSGTVTVSNSAACTASATCAYKLTNCGQVGSGLGYLVVGNVVAGTSFVINSESAALAIVTTDNSHVCWQIN